MKDGDKEVHHIQNVIQNGRENCGNNRKRPLENGSEEVAEAVPYSLDDFGDVLELKAETVEPVNNTLTEAEYGLLDGIPCADDVFPEAVIRIPQVFEGGGENCNNGNDSENGTGNSTDGTAEARD